MWSTQDHLEKIRHDDILIASRWQTTFKCNEKANPLIFRVVVYYIDMVITIIISGHAFYTCVRKLSNTACRSGGITRIIPRCPICKSSNGNLLEGWAPVDGFYGCPIFNSVAEILLHDKTPGPVFCPSLGVSSDYAQPITGQVTEVTYPVIGWAQSELTPSKRQKTGPE